MIVCHGEHWEAVIKTIRGSICRSPYRLVIDHDSAVSPSGWNVDGLRFAGGL